MVGPVVHAELTVSPDVFPSPLSTKAAQNETIFDTLFGDHTKNIVEGAADSGAANLLSQKNSVSRELTAFSEDPDLGSVAHVSCFTLLHSVSADSNENSQAECGGISRPLALPECAEAHMAPVCAGSVYEVTELHNPSTFSSLASVNSCEESTSLHVVRRDRESVGPQGANEDVTMSHIACDRSCSDVENFASAQRTVVGLKNGYDSAQDPAEEVPSPCLQQADAVATSSLHPISSESSSVVTTIYNVTPESSSSLASNHETVDATESRWTDAKHESYLDFVETSFMMSFYGGEYCSLDICGQQPSHQAPQNPSPWPATPSEFKSWQSGDWRRRSLLKPPMFACVPLSLRPSPWINHFRNRKVPRSTQYVKGEDASTFGGVDEEEEVESPLSEVNEDAPGHDPTGGELGGIASSVREAMEPLRLDGGRKFTQCSNSVSCQSAKKRRLEQVPSTSMPDKFTRCSRAVSISAQQMSVQNR